MAGKIGNRTKYMAGKIDEKAGITQTIREQIAESTKGFMEDKGITKYVVIVRVFASLENVEDVAN